MSEINDVFRGDRAKKADKTSEKGGHKILWHRRSLNSSQYICCAIILLAVIRLKARFLLSMEDVSHCLDERKGCLSLLMLGN